MTIQIQNIHVNKWFQQYTNSDPELNPDPDTVTAAMADSAFHVIIEKRCFAPYDLACSREIFYNKPQFYCIVKIIWWLQVKVYLLIALNETKTSHSYTYRGKIRHVLLQLWRKQARLGRRRKYVWTRDLTRRSSICSPPKPSPAELILLRLTVLFLNNPSSSNFEILGTATSLFCTSGVCLQAAGIPALMF